MQLKTSNSNAKTESTLVNLSSPQGLLSTLQELRQTVESEGKDTFNQWRSHIQQLNRPPIEFFFEGDRLLKQHTAELFGQSPPQRRVRIMVTLPTEAATDYEMVLAPHHKKRVFKGDRILLLRCEVCRVPRVVGVSRGAAIAYEERETLGADAPYNTVLGSAQCCLV